MTIPAMSDKKQQSYSRHARNYLLVLNSMRKVFALLQWLSPALTGRFAAWLWFRPASQTRLRKKLPVFDRATKFQFRSGENNIVCHCWPSDGARVLLLHGWSGNSRQFSSLITALIDQGFEVLALDAPAHGESTGKSTNALEIAEAIRQLESDKGPFQHVITHSFGIMCLARACHLGITFERLIAISPPLNGLGLLEKFGKTFNLNKQTLDAMRRQIESHFNRQVWELLNLEKADNAIDKPCLIIHDQDDKDVPVDEGKALARSWPNTSIHVTRGLGHRRILRSEETTNLCNQFLKP